MIGDKKERRLWWIAVVGIMATIFALSSIPDELKPPDAFSCADKVQHFTAYGALALALYGAIRRTATSRSIIFWGATSLFIAAFYGVTDEFHQHFVPGRSRSFLDWLADLTGIVIVILILHIAQTGGRKD